MLAAFDIDVHVSALQEVTVESSLEAGGYDFVMDATKEWITLLAKPPGCFRACGVLFDQDHLVDISNIKVGHSHVVAKVRLKEFPTLFVIASVHFPHSKRPISDLADALQSLGEDLERYVQDDAPMAVLGDLNVMFLMTLLPHGLPATDGWTISPTMTHG